MRFLRLRTDNLSHFGRGRIMGTTGGDSIDASAADGPVRIFGNGGNDTIAAVSVMGYDAYYTALEAIKNAGSTDPAAVKAALPGTTDTGVSGAIAFDDIGDALRDSAFVKECNTELGVWDFVSVATVG